MLIKKIIDVYKDGGIDSVVERGTRRCLRCRANVAISWVKTKTVRKFIGKRLKTLSPPLLIISLPRSGSSWVGETLGNSTSSLYLREPVTGTYQTMGGVGTAFDIDILDPPKYYKVAADLAFSGIPAFQKTIVKEPEQWSLLHRKYRRIVIKEVNPLALNWYLQNYQPRVIFLVRHPAAVALSYWNLGWRNKYASNREGFFSYHGGFQGRILYSALQNLKNYEDYLTVTYEDVCNNPISIFQRLFSFACLEWDSKMEEFINKHTSDGDRSIHWTISRESKSMTLAWKEQIGDTELSNLMNTFGEYELPWYTSSSSR